MRNQKPKYYVFLANPNSCSRKTN